MNDSSSLLFDDDKNKDAIDDGTKSILIYGICGAVVVGCAIILICCRICTSKKKPSNRRSNGDVEHGIVMKKKAFSTPVARSSAVDYDSSFSGRASLVDLEIRVENLVPAVENQILVQRNEEDAPSPTMSFDEATMENAQIQEIPLEVLSSDAENELMEEAEEELDAPLSGPSTAADETAISGRSSVADRQLSIESPIGNQIHQTPVKKNVRNQIHQTPVKKNTPSKLPTTPRIIRPEENAEGLRRTPRNRMAPCNILKGEHPVYQYDENGLPTLVDIVVCPNCL